jgi:hypothetical protein
MERELWHQLHVIVVRLDNLWTNGWFRGMGEIVMVFLWAVVHDRPIPGPARRATGPENRRLCSLHSPPSSLTAPKARG